MKRRKNLKYHSIVAVIWQHLLVVLLIANESRRKKILLYFTGNLMQYLMNTVDNPQKMVCGG